MTDLPTGPDDRDRDDAWNSLLAGGDSARRPLRTSVSTGPVPPAEEQEPPSPWAAEAGAESRRSRRELREAAHQDPFADFAAAGASAANGADGVRSRADRRASSGYADGAHDEVRPRRRRAVWWWLVAIVVIGGLAAGAYAFLQPTIAGIVARFEPAPDYEGTGTGELVFMIHEGDTGASVAENLLAQDVTASYDAFYDLLLEESPEPEFHPGAYRMASQMSARSALDALLNPANKLENTFVIPEGTSLPVALVSISEGTGIPLDQLQAAAAEPPQSYGLPAEATSLEGFLAPRTFTLDPNVDARTVLQTLVDRQFQALDEAGVPADQRWRTIVLASVVQREAGSNLDDFPKIARVFQNRLDQGMHLESDATVAYGTGNTHTVWTTDEERADASNPYNTYANPGLPAGPIGNPGDVAINAAIHPADGPWLFFVPVNLETGETAFSTTADEHLAAVERLQEWCAANADSGYCD